jgi:hypothetical protein
MWFPSALLFIGYCFTWTFFAVRWSHLVDGLCMIHLRMCTGFPLNVRRILARQNQGADRRFCNHDRLSSLALGLSVVLVPTFPERSFCWNDLYAHLIQYFWKDIMGPYDTDAVCMALSSIGHMGLPICSLKRAS